MSIAFCFITPSSSNASLSKPNPHRPFLSSSSPPPTSLHLRLSLSPASLSLHYNNNPHRHLLTAFSTANDAVSFPGGDDDNNNNNHNGNSGGGGGGGGGDEGSSAEDKNREEALMVLAEAGRSLKNLPKDLAAAIEAGRIPGAVVSRFLELEKSPVLRWLMQFGAFKERLLADDLFLAKVFMECGVGMFTKTAAEYERRRENFFNELEIVFADVVMAILADFMLVFLPAPTVSLRPPLATSAGTIAKFFHNCPDNAFQVALAGTSYSFLQRLGAVVRNGTKLFAVGTASSLVGTAVTNALINARKAVNKDSAAEVENVPIISTSAAYGVYMAVSSNLRYQILAGVIEQRILEPMLHQHKLWLSAFSFAVRTGNTFLGSLLWVDYARWIGVQ
ncbi:protein RETICULATA-RELATED 4, chloroplastic [Quercus lobata]|uniref:Protein RETICULATA-RELATED 4, chloroplastic n=1 Tax=Quercus lobata TaxID=97700 RepID=A0A7N2KKS0_QUELO|nr:protein RETICULATA-RELATED 4, chloroplastic [Quercus lobata]